MPSDSFGGKRCHVSKDHWMGNGCTRRGVGLCRAVVYYGYNELWDQGKEFMDMLQEHIVACCDSPADDSGAHATLGSSSRRVLQWQSKGAFGPSTACVRYQA